MPNTQALALAQRRRGEHLQSLASEAAEAPRKRNHNNNPCVFHQSSLCGETKANANANANHASIQTRSLRASSAARLIQTTDFLLANRKFSTLIIRWEQTGTSQAPPIIPQLLIVLPGRKEAFQVNPSQRAAQKVGFSR